MGNKGNVNEEQHNAHDNTSKIEESTDFYGRVHYIYFQKGNMHIACKKDILPARKII